MLFGELPRETHHPPPLGHHDRNLARRRRPLVDRVEAWEFDHGSIIAPDPALSDRCIHPARAEGCALLALGIAPDGGEVPGGPRDEDREEPVVRGEGEDHATPALVQLQRVAWHAAPIREIPDAHGRHDVVLERVDALRHAGVPPVRADDAGYPGRARGQRRRRGPAPRQPFARPAAGAHPPALDCGPAGSPPTGDARGPVSRASAVADMSRFLVLRC